MSASERLATKTEFASLANVKPPRVSQWLAEGKIKPASLVGKGRHAKIRVEAAFADLRSILDTSMARNEVSGGTNLKPPPPVPANVPSDPAPDPDAYRARTDLSDDFVRGALYGAHATAYWIPNMMAVALYLEGVPFEIAAEVYNEQRGELANFLISQVAEQFNLITDDETAHGPNTPTQFAGIRFTFTDPKA